MGYHKLLYYSHTSKNSPQHNQTYCKMFAVISLPLKRFLGHMIYIFRAALVHEDMSVLKLNKNKLLITCNLVCCNTTVNCNNLASVANILQSTQKFTLTVHIQNLIELRENFRNSSTKNDALAAGQLQNGISADRCSTTLPLHRNATRIQTAGNQLSFKESCSHQQRLAQTGLSDFIN